MKLRCILFIVAMSILASRPQACEFHGGFGGPGWSGYGHRAQGYSLDNYAAPQERSREAVLQLTMPAMVNAKRGLTSALSIAYQDTSAGEASDIQIEFDVHPDISIITNEVKTSGKGGEHIFSVMPMKMGIYRLALTAKYTQRPDLPERHDVIYLKVSE